MHTKYENIAIALAGIAQSIYLIEEIAQTGKVNEALLETSINSLFQMNPSQTIDIYGNTHQLKHGLEKLLTILDAKTTASHSSIKRMLSLMRLQKKISRSPEALDLLTQRLNQAKKQADYFHLKHPTLIANLADIYLAIIQPFRFRFFISGNQQVFAIKENMEKIRTLLLTAVRASVLWRQLGGSRLQLIYARKKIRASTLHLLNNLTQ